MGECVLKIQHLEKEYKKSKVLKDISLELEAGKIYGLIGKNGAGKTTLMRIIAGLSYPTSGSVELFGKSDYKDYNKQLSNTGTLIEYPSLIGGMNAKENILVTRIMRGIWTGRSDEDLLEMVGLFDVGKKKVKNYSLGMKQRLGIALAMISNPKLLILDEPVNGLDPVGVVEIRNLIKKLNEKEKITVLISSHNLPELYQTATDYIIIDKGSIRQVLTLEELENKCEHYIRIECDDNKKLAQVLESKLGTKNFKIMDDNSVRLYDFNDDRQKVSSILYDNGVKVSEFSSEGETLENYFLSIVGGADKNE